MIGAKMKYVTFDGYSGEQIIIFPKKIQHSHFADSIEKLSFGTMRPIAGGFIIDGQCVGESESLRMKSRLDADTALIPKLLDLDLDEEIKLSGVTDMGLKSVVSKNKAKRDRKKARR